MEHSARNGSFIRSGDDYDAFMGRYSNPLASAFADLAGVSEGMSALDVGCGPGALTKVLSDRLGPEMVAAIDPSPPFVAECSNRCAGVRVEEGDASEIPHPDDSFDAVLCQLVLPFVEDSARAGREFHRVVRSGGVVAACVWDADEEMEMLRHFWDAALALDVGASAKARTLRFGRPGELTTWLKEADFGDIVETTLEVSSTYRDFDDLWAGFTCGIGPAGGFCLSLDDADRAALHDELFLRLGSPAEPFTLSGVARGAVGRVR